MELEDVLQNGTTAKFDFITFAVLQQQLLLMMLLRSGGASVKEWWCQCERVVVPV